MTYGLKAKPRERAQFRAPEVGSFVHYVLQHVAADAPEGGLAAMMDERIGELTRTYTGRYIDEKLGGREGKSARFMYLYERLAAGGGAHRAGYGSRIARLRLRPAGL